MCKIVTIKNEPQLSNIVKQNTMVFPSDTITASQYHHNTACKDDLWKNMAYVERTYANKRC